MRITVCGSGRFKGLIHGVCEDLQNRGFIVLKPPLHDMTFTNALKSDEALLAWKGATFAHLQRISVGDVCLFVNPGGYMGTSSTLELGAAVAQHKLIVAFQHDAELAREGLFNYVLETDDHKEALNRLLSLLVSESH